MADVKTVLDTVEGDEKTGVKIVLKALEAPVRQIAETPASKRLDHSRQIMNAGKVGYGSDAYNEKYVDMIKRKFDPTKVTRSVSRTQQA